MSDIPVAPTLESLGFDPIPNRSGVKVKCFFHQEDRPSAVVYTYYFKCFACGIQGDATRLLHDQGGLDWDEAKSRAAQLAGTQHSGVRTQRRSSSTLSGRSGIQRGSRPFVPFRRGV